MSRIGERIASYKIDHPEQNYLSPEIKRNIKAILEKYQVTLTRIKTEDEKQSHKNLNSRREEILKEVPKISLIITAIRSFLDWQLNKTLLITDQDIMKILHELQNEIKISPNTFKLIQYALYDFLESRKIARRLITNSLQSKKRLVETVFPKLSPKDIHDLASKLIVKEGILGVFGYIEKETYDRLIKDNVRGFHAKRYFSPKTKKKNKLKNLVLVSFELRPKKEFDEADLRRNTGTRYHEDMHGICYFIKDFISKSLNAEEKNKLFEERKSKIDRLYTEYKTSKGDINDENSDKHLKFNEFLDLTFEIRLNSVKRILLSELASQLIGGRVRYIASKKESPFPHFDSYLNFYNNDTWTYKKNAFNTITNFSLKHISKEQEVVFSKRKEYWKELLMKEMKEITNFISDFINEYFIYLPIVINLITISEPENVMKNLKNFKKLLEDDKKEKEIQKKL